MVFGVLVGTYSSIVISAPLLIYLRLRTGDRPAPAAKTPAAAAPKAKV